MRVTAIKLDGKLTRDEIVADMRVIVPGEDLLAGDEVVAVAGLDPLESPVGEVL